MNRHVAASGRFCAFVFLSLFSALWAGPADAHRGEGPYRAPEVVHDEAKAGPNSSFNYYRFNRNNVEQGLDQVDKGPWYEWWYYKVVLEDGNSFYWVYGVVNPWDTKGTQPASHAYVKMGHFGENETIWAKFPINQFQAAYDRSFVRVGNNEATDKKLKGSLIHEGEEISWDLAVEHEWGWNALGWASGLNHLTNISWYPAQASALMSGEIIYKGKRYTLNREKAYQDRNWGRSFPKWWFWLVGNKFNESNNATLACGGGLPKLVNQEVMTVLLCGLKLDGKEYRFRNIDGHAYKYDIEYGHWELSLSTLNRKLYIKAEAPEESFMNLQFLTPQNTLFNDMETLTGSMQVELFERSWWGAWKSKKRLTTNFAGIEYGAADVGEYRER